MEALILREDLRESTGVRMAVDSGKRLWVIPLYSVKYTYIVPAQGLRTGRNIDVETTGKQGQIVCLLL